MERTFPHRGAWRHALWCDANEVADRAAGAKPCTCDLDAVRQLAMSGIVTPRTDDMLDAVYRAIERFETEEKRQRVWRRVTGGKVERVTHTRDGSRILTPRRSALARYVTDAVLTELRTAE